MSLDLGALYGTIGLDDAPFQRGLDRAFDSLGSFGPKAVKVAAVAGAAVATAMVTSLVQNINAEAANDKLAAQLGLSEAESERIGGVAGALYADAYGESMDQVNEAVAAVMSSVDGMREASSADLETLTAKALDFATAFEIDVARAAQVAGQMVKTGLADNADEAFDLLVASAQKVPATLREDLLDAIDEYGPAFAQMGLDGQAAFAMLVEASDKGTFGIDKTGDAMKEFAILVGSDVARTKPVIDDLGLSYEEMATKILAGGEQGAEASAQIVEALLAIEDPSAKAQAAIALFGSPLEDLGTDYIPTFLQALEGGSSSMDGFGGAAERMGATLNDNAAASLTSLKRQAEMAFMSIANWGIPAFSDFAGTLATEFGPAVAQVVDAILWLYDRLVELGGVVESNQTTVTIIAGVITAMLVPAFIAWGTQATIAAAKNAVAWATSKAQAISSGAIMLAILTGQAIGWAATGAAAVASAARQAAAWLLSKGAAISSGAIMLGVLAAQAVAWGAGALAATASALVMAAAWLISIGPLLLVGAAIAAFIYLVIKYWDEIVAATKAAWDWVVDLVKGIPDKLVAIFMNFSLVGLIIKHWDDIKNGVMTKGGELVDWVKGLPGRITEAAAGMFDGISSAFQSALNWIISKWNGLEFKIGGGSFMGVDIPSVTLSTPDIGLIGVGRAVGGWGLKGLATGTDFWEGGPVWVGEEGPEIVNLPRGSSVTPNHELGKGGGTTQVQVFTQPGVDGYLVGRGFADRWDALQTMPSPA